MSPEILVPVLIVAGAIVIFFLRRTSEVAAPKHPASEVAAHKEVLPLDDEDRVVITHPLIRRAAEKALADGGKAAKYIVRDGDRIYFAFGRLQDPVQRKNSVELIKRIQDSGQVNITEFIQFVRRVLNK